MLAGRYHSIETFGTLDGPGIRYVLFLQGCPLRCKYCHNRDTWDKTQGKSITVSEVVKDIKKYLVFYQNSGGGITASGGEPTLQAEFVTDLFRQVKALGLNTALDTSGFVDIKQVSTLLEETDLVLLDIKSLEPAQHQELTGVTNERILEFAKYLDQINKPVWIRYVLIPGITDHPAQLEKLAEFKDNLGNVQKVDILGYHKLGVPKWELCGEEDPLKHVPAADLAQVERVRGRFSDTHKA